MPPQVVGRHHHLGTQMPSGGVHPITAPHADVAEEEAGGDLERFARGDERIRAAVTLMDEGARRAGQLRKLLFHQAVAAVVVGPELAPNREDPVEPARDYRTVSPVIGPDHREHAAGWEELL